MDVSGVLLTAVRPDMGGTHVGPDGLRVCDECGRPREMVGEFMGARMRLPVMCACQERERAREDAREKRQKADRRAAIAFPVPAMRGMTFGASDGRSARQMGMCRRYADALPAPGHGLVLTGPPGCGKTYAAACIANAALDRGLSVRVWSVPRLVDGLDREDEAAIARADLVVLDDLGAERDTSYGLEGVWRAVDTRALSGKPMVVSTNRTVREMVAADSVGWQRVYDRVLGACLPVAFEGVPRGDGERWARWAAALS